VVHSEYRKPADLHISVDLLSTRICALCVCPQDEEENVHSLADPYKLKIINTLCVNIVQIIDSLI